MNRAFCTTLTSSIREASGRCSQTEASRTEDHACASAQKERGR